MLVEWAKFWPTSGRQQTWDAVGKAGDAWLLGEAKSNWPEFCSPPSTAKEGGGLPQIRRAFELARIMGTSVRMIERHYGTLLDGAHAAIVGRLDALRPSSSRPPRPRPRRTGFSEREA